MGDTKIIYQEEAALGRSLRGRVVCSALHGDMTCEYEMDIPEDIMNDYVHQEDQLPS